jgi:hypothetical protein
MISSPGLIPGSLKRGLTLGRDLLTWTDDGLLRHVVYEGLREDKSPRDVRRAG